MSYTVSADDLIEITAIITNNPLAVAVVINGVAVAMSATTGSKYTTGSIYAYTFGECTDAPIYVTASNTSGGNLNPNPPTITITAGSNPSTVFNSFLSSIDWALKSKIYTQVKDILGLTNINNDGLIYPKDIALRKISEKRGRDVVEFFNMWRTSSRFDMSRQRSSVARRGITTAYVEDTKTDVNIYKAVPMTLTYEVWFWTQSLDKKNQLEEWYAWWIHTDPNLDIYYNSVYPLEMDLHFGESVDEGTVPEEHTKGVYHVLRVPITIDAWVFKGIEEKVIKHIMLAIYDEDVQSNFLAYHEYNASESKQPDELTEYKWYKSSQSSTASIVGDTQSMYGSVLEITAPTTGVHSLLYKNNTGTVPSDAESFGKICNNLWGYEIRLRLKVISESTHYCQMVKVDDQKFQFMVRWGANKIIFTNGVSWGLSDTEYSIDLTDDYHVIGISVVNTFCEISIDGVEVIRATLTSPVEVSVPNITWGDNATGSSPYSGGTCRYDYVKYMCKTGMLYYHEIDEDEAL